MKKVLYVLTPDADEIAEQMSLQYKPELFASLVHHKQQLAHLMPFLSQSLAPEAFQDVYFITQIVHMREQLHQFLDHHGEELYAALPLQKRGLKNLAQASLDDVIRNLFFSSSLSSSFRQDLYGYFESMYRVYTPQRATELMEHYSTITLFSLAHPSAHVLLSYVQQYLQMYHHNLALLHVIYDPQDDDEKTLAVIEEKAKGLQKVLEEYGKHEWTLKSLIPPLPKQRDKAYFLTLDVHHFFELLKQSLLAQAPSSLVHLLTPLDNDRFERFVVYRAADAFLEIAHKMTEKKNQEFPYHKALEGVFDFLYTAVDPKTQKNLYVLKNLSVFKSFWPYLSLSFKK